MILRDSIQIITPPSDVWEILQDPELMPLWNPKCKACFLHSSDPIRKGSRYDAVFVMRGRSQKSTAEVFVYEPGTRLTTRYTGGVLSVNQSVDESFELSSNEDGTIVIHKVDFTQSGLPLLVRLLMKFISTYGHPMGVSSLEQLKDLVEGDH